MKNRPNRRMSIFDALFGGDDFNLFGDSFFSMSHFSGMEMDNNNFPADDDANFHKTEENIETGTHIIKKEVWTSVDGTQRFERTSSQSKSQARAISAPTTEQLRIELKSAVENQEFEKAIEIRDELKKRGEKE